MNNDSLNPEDMELLRGLFEKKEDK
jgi:hypothetical protein